MAINIQHDRSISHQHGAMYELLGHKMHFESNFLILSQISLNIFLNHMLENMLIDSCIENYLN